MDTNPGFWGLHARGLVGTAGMAAVAFGTWQLGQRIALALPGILAWPLAAVLVLAAFVVSVGLFDQLLFALFVNPRGRLYVFRGNRRRRQLALQDAATVKGHALAMQALENLGHTATQTELSSRSPTVAKLASLGSDIDWDGLLLAAIAAAAELRESVDTLGRSDARRTDLLNRAEDLDAIANYAAEKVAARRQFETS